MPSTSLFVLVLVILAPVSIATTTQAPLQIRNDACFAPILSKIDVLDSPEDHSMETAIEIVNCFFRSSMPDWVVDCTGEYPHTPTDSAFYHSCVQKKFKGMQYAVLGLFQGYLAQLPLHHRQFLFLSSVQSHSISLLRSIDDLARLQSDTILAQRTALRSFDSSSHRLLTAIETYLEPIVRFLPTIESANNITSDLQLQLMHADEASKAFSSVILVFVPLTVTAILVLLSFVNNLPLRYIIPTMGVIWLMKSACILATSWALFSTILAFFLFQSFFGTENPFQLLKERKYQAMKEKEANRSEQWNQLFEKAKTAWLA